MKRPAGWPLAITAILAVFAGGNLMMMRLASNDPSFAVEPDYYDKAVAYDSTMAAAARSAALGWSASSAVAAAAGASSGTVVVRLTDAAGRPVTGARVKVDARFNARANEILRSDLEERAPGEYAAPIAARHAGQWEVRIDATRGADHFTASTRASAPVP